jgi:hypothetical protein
MALAKQSINATGKITIYFKEVGNTHQQQLPIGHLPHQMQSINPARLIREG